MIGVYDREKIMDVKFKDFGKRNIVPGLQLDFIDNYLIVIDSRENEKCIKTFKIELNNCEFKVTKGNSSDECKSLSISSKYLNLKIDYSRLDDSIVLGINELTKIHMPQKEVKIFVNDIAAETLQRTIKLIYDDLVNEMYFHGVAEIE